MNDLAINQDQQMRDMTAPYATHTANMLLNPQIMNALESFATMMASGIATVPKHLQKNKSDCMAVVMQAAQWGMNPYAVAQKTHVTQGGQLGYEAQLVNAVITSMAPIKGRPEYEFIGDWDKILGKVQERKSDKGGKYYVQGWSANDEVGLGVIIRCTLKGEDEPRELKLMLTQCWPRFSTQWATDPQQQICYAGLKKFARRYCPDVVLGVYTPDELEVEQPRQEREINPQQRPSTSLKTKLEDTVDVEPEQDSTTTAMPTFDEPTRDYSSALQTMIDGIKECTTLDELNQWGADIAEFAGDNKDADMSGVRKAFAAKKQSLNNPGF